VQDPGAGPAAPAPDGGQSPDGQGDPHDQGDDPHDQGDPDNQGDEQPDTVTVTFGEVSLVDQVAAPEQGREGPFWLLAVTIEGTDAEAPQFEVVGASGGLKQPPERTATGGYVLTIHVPPGQGKTSVRAVVTVGSEVYESAAFEMGTEKETGVPDSTESEGGSGVPGQH
jgi:hypothetical protein